MCSYTTITCVVTGAFLSFGGIARATDFSSTNFTVKDPVIAGGAGYATSTSFRLWSSVAQLGIGTSSATTFGVRAGFLYFSEEAATPTPTPTPTPSPSEGGGAHSADRRDSFRVAVSYSVPADSPRREATEARETVARSASLQPPV